MTNMSRKNILFLLFLLLIHISKLNLERFYHHEPYLVPYINIYTLYDNMDTLQYRSIARLPRILELLQFVDKGRRHLSRTHTHTHTHIREDLDDGRNYIQSIKAYVMFHPLALSRSSGMPGHDLLGKDETERRVVVMNFRFFLATQSLVHVYILFRVVFDCQLSVYCSGWIIHVLVGRAGSSRRERVWRKDPRSIYSFSQTGTVVELDLRALRKHKKKTTSRHCVFTFSSDKGAISVHWCFLEV
jgi:hypothetical protein